MTTKLSKPNSARLTSAVGQFIEVDKRIRRGEISAWGRKYKQAIKELREAYDEASGDAA